MEHIQTLFARDLSGPDLFAIASDLVDRQLYDRLLGGIDAATALQNFLDQYAAKHSMWMTVVVHHAPDSIDIPLVAAAVTTIGALVMLRDSLNYDGEEVWCHSCNVIQQGTKSHLCRNTGTWKS